MIFPQNILSLKALATFFLNSQSYFFFHLVFYHVLLFLFHSKRYFALRGDHLLIYLFRLNPLSLKNITGNELLVKMLFCFFGK